MRGTRPAGRLATFAAIATLVAGACGATTPTGAPVASGTSGPAPAVSIDASSGAASPGAPSGTPAANTVSALPRPTDPRLALGTLLGVPDEPLDPDMAALRDEILRQLGDAPDAPVTLPTIKLASLRTGPGDAPTAPGAAVNGSIVLVGFLLIDMAIMGRILPSKQAADALAGTVRQVAQEGGLDGPDSVPDQPLMSESVPFDATTDQGSHATGTMETHATVKAEGSLVSIELDRQLVLHFTAGAASTSESGTTTITIQNTGSVDFCPDVGGVVPLKIETAFTLAMPSSTVKATVKGDFLALVDDAANHVYTNGNAQITRLTTTGNDDVDVQFTGMNIDPSGTVTGGDIAGRAPSEQVAGQAAGAALVDIENAVPTILKSAEKAWQSSSCVAIQLPDSGDYAGPMKDGSAQKDVQPGSNTELKAQVHQRFQHREVNLPIQATLRTEKTIDPTRLPSTPSKLTYTAPDRPSAHNDVVLETISKRGKSKLTMRFDTTALKLMASVNGTVHVDELGNVYDSRITLTPLSLTMGDDGSFHGDATVSWTTTYTPPVPDCQPKTFTGTFGTRVTARPDPDDPTRVFVRFTFEPGPIRTETLVCHGINFPFSGTTLLSSWAVLGNERPVALDGSVAVNGTVPGGTSRLTISIKKVSKQ